MNMRLPAFFVNFIKRRGFLLLSFFIPAGILAAAYVGLRVYPFGQRSVLVVDLDAQYIDFYMALRRIVFEGESPLYTWNLMMGGNFIGIISYYLSSPFSLITLLFPEKYILESLLVMTLAKIGSAGLAMAIYLKISQNARGYALLIFSTPYALMAYMLSYSYNIMWLDGLVFLPLILLGVEKIVREGSISLYCVALVLMVIANYYIAYMICIFAVVYFIYQEVLYFIPGQGKVFIKRLALFLSASILSAGMAAYLLVPTFFTLTAGKLNIEPGLFDLTPKFNALDLLPKLLIGSYDMASGKLPNLYAGIAMILLAGLFFMSRGISLRRKVAAAGLLAFLLLNFYWFGLDLIWHGMQVPKGFPYRYSFIFSFLVIILAYQAFQVIQRTQVRALIASFCLILAVIIYVKIHGYDFQPDEMLLLSFLFCCGYFVILLFINKRPKMDQLLSGLMVAIIILEAALNTFVYIRAINHEFHYKDRANYWSFVEEIRPLVEKIQRDDPQFYRVEKTFFRSYNDSITLDYPGITHFSSSFSRPSLVFLKQIGFFQPFYRLLYTGQTLPMDAILGVKYLLSDSPLNNNYALIDQVETKDGPILTYQNNDALPLGFMVDPVLSDVHINSYHPIYWQDQILRGMMSPSAEAYFVPVTLERKEMTNISVQEDSEGWIHYTRQSDGVDAAIEYHLQVETNDPVYVYWAAQDGSKMEVTLNDEQLGYFGENSENNNMILLGQFPPGTKITLRLKLMAPQAILLNDSLVYRLDMARFTQAFQQLNSHPLEITTYGDTYISGTINVPSGKNLMFTTIPFDEGWKARVDGHEYPITRLLDTFIGLELPDGSHTIVFSFTPDGLWAGCAISVVSLLLAGPVYILKKQKRSWLNSAR